MENVVLKNKPELLNDILSESEDMTAVIYFNYNADGVYTANGNMINYIISDKDYGRVTQKMISGADNVFIVINLDDDISYKSARKIIKSIIKIKKICKNKVKFGIGFDGKRCIGSVSYNKSEYAEDVINALNAVMIDDRREQCEFIYDLACDYLDRQFRENNYCDFRDNHCRLVRKYNCKDPAEAGCCHSYRLFRVLTVDFMYDHKPCMHIRPGGCTQKCIGCKLYTCDMLRKEGIRFSLNKMLLTDCFFSAKQKMVLKNNIFRRKDEVLDKAMSAEKSKSPIFWYYLCGSHIIRTKFE